VIMRIACEPARVCVKPPILLEPTLERRFNGAAGA
jgi:hypothetical protein